MKRLFRALRTKAPEGSTSSRLATTKFLRSACCGSTALLLSAFAAAQVVTIDTHNGTVTTGPSGTVDRRFSQIQPTHVELPKAPLDTKTRLELIRFLQSDQGFAMRPFPRGHQGLTLEANGKLRPAGEEYLTMVTANGLSAKPGDRLVITDIKFDHSKIILMLNGGPDAKHRFLQHIELGTGPMTSPVVQGTGEEATGARLTLTFSKQVPALTGKQVESLLSPLVSFEVKTPIQAFTDTLPPKLKTAILDHNVLVGMNTDMVLFAKGQPQRKIREMDGQMPFEEWVYGAPPSDVEFVRVNGNRVIRVEIAQIGKPVQIFEKDEVEGMMRTDGTPLTPGDPSGVRTVAIGDVQRDPDTQAPAAPPSLRAPGETAPNVSPTNNDRVGTMKPVQFPKQAPDDHPVAHQGEQPASAQTPGQAPNQTAPPATAPPAATTPAASTTDPDSQDESRRHPTQTAPNTPPPQ